MLKSKEAGIDTLVVIEDQPDTLLIIRSTLHQQGHQLHFFPNGRVATAQAVQALHPALILLDVQLPDQSGFDLIGSLRSIAPCIALTGFSDMSIVERAKALGFFGFLGKPIRPAYFPQQISRLLAGEAVWEHTWAGDVSVPIFS